MGLFVIPLFIIPEIIPPAREEEGRVGFWNERADDDFDGSAFGFIFGGGHHIHPFCELSQDSSDRGIGYSISIF